MGSQHFIILLTVLLFVDANTGSSKDQSTLQMVNMVFRHGDRTPESSENYPNDPYRNYSYFPFGPGELTNRGKRRAFQLGKVLRKRYDHFLGPIYFPKEVYVRTTSIPRTKMTALSLLAALYPPVRIQRWSSELKWQPIPYTYLPTKQDGLFFGIQCITYVSEYEKLFESDEMREKLEEYKSFTATLEKYTGRNITNLIDFLSIHNTLVSEDSYGLRLPEWTKKVWEELEDISAFQIKTFSYNTVLKRRNGGIMLMKMIENMQKSINGDQRKIVLFSGHDTNVAALASALDIIEWPLPKFTSAVILELHKIAGDYFVKVLYYHGIPSKTEELKIPGCDIMCPWEEFLLLTKDIIPSDDELQCDTSEGDEIRPLVSPDVFHNITRFEC